MTNFIKIIRWDNLFKNLIIYLPYLLYENNYNAVEFYKISIGFFIFCIFTIIIYLINDLTDFEIDKNNILKRKINSKKDLIFLIFFFVFFFTITLVIFNEYLKSHFLIYLLIFLFYNFYGKKIFAFDLILLNLFYLIRVFYGSSISDINLSLLIIIFLSIQFLILSLCKRIIQIKVSDTTKLSPYNLSHVAIAKKLIMIMFSINIIIFFIYIFYFLLDFNIANQIVTQKNLNYLSIIGILLIYVYFHFKIYMFIESKKISHDLIQYIINDKKIIFSLLFFLLIIGLS